jgi:hypothetical protein
LSASASWHGVEEAIRKTEWRAAFFVDPSIVVRDGVFPSHGLLAKSVIS